MKKQFIVSKASNYKINKSWLLLNYDNKQILIKMLDSLLSNQVHDSNEKVIGHAAKQNGLASIFLQKYK